jgi:hypothetical protein
MDAKITLSFNEEVIQNAKKFADAHNISLSRLTEFLFSKMTTENYSSIEELPISDWVSMVSEGKTEYVTKASSRKDLRKEYLKTRK